MTPSSTRSPGCGPKRSRVGARRMTLPGTWWNGGCGSMTETGAGRARSKDPGAGGRGDDATRESVLARTFVRLADTLANDFDVVDFLFGLSEDSVEILRAAAAGVMLADARGGLRVIASLG